ncbi:Cytospin-A [Fasciola hepatica]|uniref:Cytospin-A n=1 Tax=Fasciola hepatica TaxID=6192 RepID=A0A4E0QXZ2_FASHE|nr:Cytospin-A [Fasciola hepatica]
MNNKTSGNVSVVLSAQQPKAEVLLRAQTKSNDVFIRPVSQSSSRTQSVSFTADGNLKTSPSYQNLKCTSANKIQGNHSTVDSQNGKSAKRLKLHLSKRQHGSAANLPEVCSNTRGGTCSEPRFQSHLASFNSQSSHRISITETRKMEIEKLNFEIRRAKEELAKATQMADESRQEANHFKARLNELENGCSREDDQTNAYNPSQGEKATQIPLSAVRKPVSVTHSPPESLGTTTRLTPGGATTGLTGTVTVSSASSDFNDPVIFDFGNIDNTLDYTSHFRTGVISKIESNGRQATSTGVSVATLQGRLLQMEEANYTTNKELQATLQELWDLQRSVDEAHEEAHSLAFERAILLEALSTQTTKLDHCRFQIEQLKRLLLTDRRAQTAGSRENRFCEHYASIEQEKQVLLTQNNDLVQSSDSLARECRILTEKAAQLQDNFDAFEAEHACLKGAYDTVSGELKALKVKQNEDTGAEMFFPLDEPQDIYVNGHQATENRLVIAGQRCGPGRPIPITTGTTVRSLIQSIENQVKAVQHQKRGIATETPTTITPNSSPSGLHISHNNTSANGPVPSSTAANGAGNRVGLSQCPRMLSPTAYGDTTCGSNSAPARNKYSGPHSMLIHSTDSMIAGNRPSSPPRMVSSRKTLEVDVSPTGLNAPLLPTESDSAKTLPHAGQSERHPFRRYSSLTEADSEVRKASSGVAFCRPLETSNTTTSATNLKPNKSEPNGAAEAPFTSAVSSGFASALHTWQDPLQELARRTQAGSKRNALLRWCQPRVAGYPGVQVTNFSSLWNNGLALCALLHTYLPSQIPWKELVSANNSPVDKRHCFELAFSAAEGAGVPTTLQLHDMLNMERPDWNTVMSYITSIYRHFEVGSLSGHAPPSNMTHVVSGTVE